MVKSPPKAVQGTARWIHRPDAMGRGMLVIGETIYAVWPIDGGWRLAKQDGESYDVLVNGQSHQSCDCRDYHYRRANVDEKGCKHIAALRAALTTIGLWPTKGE